MFPHYPSVFQSFQTKQVAKWCGIEAHRWEMSVCLEGCVCRSPVSPQPHGGAVPMRVLPSELKNTRGSPKCRRLGRNLCKRAGSVRAAPHARGTRVTQLWGTWAPQEQSWCTPALPERGATLLGAAPAAVGRGKDRRGIVPSGGRRPHSPANPLPPRRGPRPSQARINQAALTEVLRSSASSSPLRPAAVNRKKEKGERSRKRGPAPRPFICAFCLLCCCSAQVCMQAQWEFAAPSLVCFEYRGNRSLNVSVESCWVLFPFVRDWVLTRLSPSICRN